MSDFMRPVPFPELISRVFNEYKVNQSIFGIHHSQFFRKENRKGLKIFGEYCDNPIGPAAGPHTQLAQNIIAAYMVGGRFFELKTVQKMDTLEIEKPCIDTGDECYNTEWSTEYTLTKAYNEYIKAWIILHLIEKLFDPDGVAPRSFIFNMSVGYDLDGIKSPRMDEFVNNMMDSSGNSFFKEYLEQLKGFIADGSLLKAAGFGSRPDKISSISSQISPVICRGVTLSTMHGCPPKEIEAICDYMLTVKKLNTFVKLNPTLLGYSTVRGIFDALGFKHIEMRKKSFTADLQYPDAKVMLTRLIETAKKMGIGFGVKLTNTLASVNKKGVLPGDEMYMSGRALFPLSINLAARLSEDFDGKLLISYSGGASKLNIGRIFENGIRPITMVTDMLKPGGHYRLGDCASKLESSEGWDGNGEINVPGLAKLAEESLSADYLKREWRGDEVSQVSTNLPLYDCYVAPCVTACAINQDIPEYIRLVGQKKYDEALELIASKNALPAITGHICDHHCMRNCTRLDYEGPVDIRAMKRIAVEKAFAKRGSDARVAREKNDVSVAVIGAGPAGLSAASFLAEKGFNVSVFEKQKKAGGVVRNIIPKFRIPEDVILSDINYIEGLGVKFNYGVSPDFKIDQLKNDGFKYICVGVGAEKENLISMEGENENVYKALDFLALFHNSPDKIKLGGHIVVVGGGNTAMDCARAAKRVKGVESVSVVYRRSLSQMPADREEYDMALEDGIEFNFLTNPKRFETDGSLICRVMKLGEPDESGRQRPVETDETITLKVDSVISAIGEKVDQELLSGGGIPINEQGRAETDLEILEATEDVYLIGDTQSGPGTVIQCIADARRATDAILKKEGMAITPEPAIPNISDEQLTTTYKKKGALKAAIDFQADTEAFAQNEAFRCLECDQVCNKCIEVCPNRANMAIALDQSLGFKDRFQVIHLDAYCNECGNCGYFCPHHGNPYKDKLTVFNLADDYKTSANNGFWVEGNAVSLRLNQKEIELSLGSDRSLSHDGSADETLKQTIQVMETIFERHSYLLGPVDD